MEQITTARQRKSAAAQLEEGCRNNRPVTLSGMVHTLRAMGGVTFLVLRTGEEIVQCVCGRDTGSLCRECAVRVTGSARREERAPGGIELADAQVQCLSRPAAALPAPVFKQSLHLNLDTQLGLRPVALRSLREHSVFRIQAAVSQAFRDYLQSQGFVEIHTPKIVHAGAEGGSNIFRLDYFGRKAFLAQSPQFYKQTMVGVFERVFEIAPVFRAEKHSTPRHLNEYTSMDFEVGFIDSFYDIMALETGFLQAMTGLLARQCSGDLERLGAALPQVEQIPAVRFDWIKRAAAEKYGYRIRDPYDLEPEEEQAIGRYAQEEWGADFVFVTHYPSKKRPFYAMDDPEDPRYTLSFDLLFHGMEVTTGGQRIHDYATQVEKMRRRGMDPEAFQHYLMIHKHGMPPHGGLGAGLERLTMKLCGLDNIRKACLFPRDLGRLEP